MSATLRRVLLNGAEWRIASVLKREVYRKKENG